MENLKLHFATEARSSEVALAMGEGIVWTGVPNRREYFLFWLPRAALPALIWTLGWSYALFRQVGYGSDTVTVVFPAILALLGVVAIIATPISALISHRYTYLITSNRVILHDAITRRSRYVHRSDIDRIDVILGWTNMFGSLALTAGTVETPDGDAKMKLMLVGIKDVDVAKAAIV